MCDLSNYLSNVWYDTENYFSTTSIKLNNMFNQSYDCSILHDDYSNITYKNFSMICLLKDNFDKNQDYNDFIKTLIKLNISGTTVNINYKTSHLEINFASILLNASKKNICINSFDDLINSNIFEYFEFEDKKYIQLNYLTMDTDLYIEVSVNSVTNNVYIDSVHFKFLHFMILDEFYDKVIYSKIEQMQVGSLDDTIWFIFWDIPINFGLLEFSIFSFQMFEDFNFNITNISMIVTETTTYHEHEYEFDIRDINKMGQFTHSLDLSQNTFSNNINTFSIKIVTDIPIPFFFHKHAIIHCDRIK